MKSNNINILIELNFCLIYQKVVVFHGKFYTISVPKKSENDSGAYAGMTIKAIGETIDSPA